MRKITKLFLFTSLLSVFTRNFSYASNVILIADNTIVMLPDDLIISRTINGTSIPFTSDEYFDESINHTSIYAQYAGETYPLPSNYTTGILAEDEISLFGYLSTFGIARLAKETVELSDCTDSEETALIARGYSGGSALVVRVFINSLGKFKQCYLTSKSGKNCYYSQCQSRGAKCLINEYTLRCNQSGDWSAAACKSCKCAAGYTYDSF
ncbi:hypothetical protein KAFR_0G03850 [Kazachstania africana CBS 2517]|uniref:Uncharacterized protein n=1 Tax=Kazachstania africana (strain ATCC 22294 / BCRC 22015 / CBS 2517 / CECT 1963 / NBRC 1671 / NRRL Y-8276) TaxID=1071382 RepID=H2AYG8_KAZAF|nr:hypothetical protein KAFR_0G03850 [Kazachstania africana CBS 2517]CCF59418.1 hypothetical protein KAFR_0G03850 [Kazachstania africana CBS 2517]